MPEDAEPVNDTGKWLLQSGCWNGTLLSRDGGTAGHASEQDAREHFQRQVAAWARIGYRPLYARIVPPEAKYSDAIILA